MLISKNVQATIYYFKVIKHWASSFIFDRGVFKGHGQKGAEIGPFVWIITSITETKTIITVVPQRQNWNGVFKDSMLLNKAFDYTKPSMLVNQILAVYVGYRPDVILIDI